MLPYLFIIFIYGYLEVIYGCTININILILCFLYLRQRANYPLLVNFQGELGSDLSGLRSDFCSFTTEFITGPSMKNILQSYKDYVDNAEEGEEELSGDYISKLLFGLGLVAAIGVVQCGFKEAGVWELSKNLSLDHPFNRGMQILQLAKVENINYCDFKFYRIKKIFYNKNPSSSLR